MRLIVPMLMAIPLVACAPSPAGRWTGGLDFFADDGGVYSNELIVTDGLATATLYNVVTMENPDTGNVVPMLLRFEFDGTWKREEDVAFDLRCFLDGCTTSIIVDCVFDEADAMSCNSWPDFYADDGEALQWIRD
jgi:hypothetical protein